ncbi:MAG: hypothetical protein JSS66_06700 [Armatimonadetes bacterium]|nr:hypothetical protein [Armatimonadota bacterium]
MQVVPFETLSGRTFGIKNADDGDEVLLRIEFLEPLVRLPNLEDLGRRLVTEAMRELCGPDWSYPDPETFQVGVLD